MKKIIATLLVSLLVVGSVFAKKEKEPVLSERWDENTEVFVCNGLMEQIKNATDIADYAAGIEHTPIVKLEKISNKTSDIIKTAPLGERLLNEMQTLGLIKIAEGEEVADLKLTGTISAMNQKDGNDATGKKGKYKTRTLMVAVDFIEIQSNEIIASYEPTNQPMLKYKAKR